jgi:hypothetical protein
VIPEGPVPSNISTFHEACGIVLFTTLPVVELLTTIEAVAPAPAAKMPDRNTR